MGWGVHCEREVVFSNCTAKCWQFYLHYFVNRVLQKGDIITVLKKHDNGKWFGQLGDRTGYFQFNYVEVIPESESPD